MGKDGGSVVRGVPQEDSTMIARRQASARFLGNDPCLHNGCAEVGCHRYIYSYLDCVVLGGHEYGDILKRGWLSTDSGNMLEVAVDMPASLTRNYVLYSASSNSLYHLMHACIRG